MSRFLRSQDIGRELDCMAPWKELRDDFFGPVLGCRERCDRLAAGGRLEPPIWLCTMLSAGKQGVA